MEALLICFVCGLVGVLVAFMGRRRYPEDVAADLCDESIRIGVEGRGEWRGDKEKDPGKQRGAVTRVLVFGGGACGAIGVCAGGSGPQLLIYAAIGVAGSFLWSRSRRRACMERRRAAIDFHLPIIMESIVMAVEAGADVLGAIRRVVEITSADGRTGTPDPVTELLGAVLERTERGAGLEETLQQIAAQSDVLSVRHAFLHLALAHREGGELVRPLRELGSSTQMHYQEIVEEQIAKLPVQATAPLLCTFTGLIICFITVPLLQVSSMTKRALPTGASPAVVEERGTMSLFVAFCIVPILFLLGTLALDVRRYTLESGSQQRILDAAVLEGIRALPRPESARRFVGEYLKRFGLTDDVEIEATPHSVSVLRDGVIELSFPQFFGIEAGIPYTLYARARSRPVDAVIALDLGRSQAPAVGSRWGSENEWGAATYFVGKAGLYAPPKDPLMLTARCFNPVVSALKLGAIRVHEYLDAFGDARVGVGIYPGNGYELEFVRPFGVGAPEQVVWPRYEGREVRSEDCAQAAHEELWLERYRFPSSRYGSGVPASESLLTPGGEFNEAYVPYLSVSEALWMSPVREESPASTGFGNFPAVIEAILGGLIGAPNLANRGGLGAAPRRIGVIFSGDLPRVGGARFPSVVVRDGIDSVLERYRPIIEQLGADIGVYLMILLPPAAELSSYEVATLTEFFAVRSFERPGTSLHIHPIFAHDGETLLNTLMPAILLDHSSGGIAR